MTSKYYYNPSITKRWILWLRNNKYFAAKDLDSGIKKLDSYLKGLSPAQLKLIFDLVDLMKMRNEEDKRVGNQNKGKRK